MSAPETHVVVHFSAQRGDGLGLGWATDRALWPYSSWYGRRVAECGAFPVVVLATPNWSAKAVAGALRQLAERLDPAAQSSEPV